MTNKYDYAQIQIFEKYFLAKQIFLVDLTE